MLPEDSRLRGAALLGSQEGRPFTLAMELRLPTAGTARLPVMILGHCSAGIQAGNDRWAIADWGAYHGFDNPRNQPLTRVRLNDPMPRGAAATSTNSPAGRVKRTGFLGDLISWEDGVYGTSESVLAGGA
jgi:hypothetical protein